MENDDNRAATMQGVVAEYSGLRAEINNNSMIVAQVATVGVTVGSVLIGYGLQLSSPNGWYVFLTPPIFLFPSLLYITSQWDSTSRIAAYLYVAIEKPYPEFNWEKRLSHLRRTKDTPTINFVRAVVFIFVVLILGSVGLAWVRVGNYAVSPEVFNSPVFILAVATCVTVLITVRLVFAAQAALSPRRFRAYESGWSKVLEEEHRVPEPVARATPAQ